LASRAASGSSAASATAPAEDCKASVAAAVPPAIPRIGSFSARQRPGAARKRPSGQASSSSSRKGSVTAIGFEAMAAALAASNAA